jgi:hypothetical protein
LLNVLNAGSCVLNSVFINFPAGAAYGDIALTMGHLHTMNKVVMNTAATPASDRGAKAKSDRKLHSGNKTVPVRATIQNRRDARMPLHPTVWAMLELTSPSRMLYDRHAPKQKVMLARDTNHADRWFFFFSHSSPSDLAWEACTNRPYMAKV